MDNSQKSAYPVKRFEDGEPYWEGGLTKLEAFTLAAMQGLMANPNVRQIINNANHYNGNPDKEIAMWSISLAKATLTELQKISGNG